MAYFNIKSLENLSRDVNQSNYYDLFVQNYATLNDEVQLRYYIVDRSRQMRLDLVCTDLYGDISNLQLLMFINNIDNPFGIQEDDILFWVETKDIARISAVDPKVIEDGREELINAFKASVSDPARNAYLQNRGNDQLPPNIVPDNAPKIIIDNNKVIVGANLFTNPNNQVRNSDSINDTSSLGGLTDSSGNPVTPTTPPTLTAAEDTERVLVRRFIKTGNTTTDTSTTSTSTNPNTTT